ncbi:MAG: hypothetical protein QNJ97_20455 [Myxococcota bacterium]|nr:hypothetical protein [Myxococcota bacterium]
MGAKEGLYRIIRKLGLVLTVLFLLLALACDEDDAGDEAVYLAANPPSLVQGQTVSVAITASEAFFDGTIVLPVTSEGGLTIQSITPSNDVTALMAVASTSGTAVGLHRFELDAGEDMGLLKISVLEAEAGSGTVTAEGAMGTAGATMATLVIKGQGTSFDSHCTVHAEGADGFHVGIVDVVGSGLMHVTYSIGEDQPPTQATIVVLDGLERYELPFAILSPGTYENQAGIQYLTKGQVGWVTLSHPEAALHIGTRFEIEDQAIEAGPVDIVSDTEVRIPVRMAVDYPSGSTTLTARTYTQGGAFLERMTTEVEVMDRAYIGFVPTALDLTTSDHQVDVAAEGLDLTQVTSLTIEENDQVFVSGFEPMGPNIGEVMFALTQAAETSIFQITADDGKRQVKGVVALVEMGTQAVFNPGVSVARGDRVYFPVVVQGHQMTAENVTVIGTDEIEVMGKVLIDTSCVLADIIVAKTAREGLHEISISTEGKTYNVYVRVIDSGM